MRHGRHWIRNKHAEAAAGIVAGIAAAVLLHDAYDRRARQQPLWLRPFSFW